MTLTTESPWLTPTEAVALLKAEFSVTLSPRTIENKMYRGDIPTEVVAGFKRIHRDALREWARPVEPAA